MSTSHTNPLPDHQFLFSKSPVMVVVVHSTQYQLHLAQNLAAVGTQNITGANVSSPSKANVAVAPNGSAVKPPEPDKKSSEGRNVACGIARSSSPVGGRCESRRGTSRLPESKAWNVRTCRRKEIHFLKGSSSSLLMQTASDGAKGGRSEHPTLLLIHSHTTHTPLHSSLPLASSTSKEATQRRRSSLLAPHLIPQRLLACLTRHSAAFGGDLPQAVARPRRRSLGRRVRRWARIKRRAWREDRG
jgi:hypothetical protein